MLIDDILSKPCIENVIEAGWPQFRKRLAAATKFELAPDFAASAETLVDNYDVIANAVPFCRLPFSNVWIEVAQQHRPRYMNAGIHIPAIQAIPHRIGFLLEATDNTLTAFKAHQFWLIKGAAVPFASHMAMKFDPTAARDALDLPADEEGRKREFFEIEPSPAWRNASPHARGSLNAMVRPDLPDYMSMMGATLVFAKPGETDRFGQFLYEVGTADWSGESVYLLAVLALLNTVNAAETRKVDLTGLNKQRVKRGVHPLANHYTLTISPRLKARVGMGNDPQHRHLRAHLVRGHWKVRKSGIYFWRPFARGERDRGVIEKGYKVIAG